MTAMVQSMPSSFLTGRLAVHGPSQVCDSGWAGDVPLAMIDLTAHVSRAHGRARSLREMERDAAQRADLREVADHVAPLDEEMHLLAREADAADQVRAEVALRVVDDV